MVNLHVQFTGTEAVVSTQAAYLGRREVLEQDFERAMEHDVLGDLLL